jgi:hypothetical protein
MARTLRRDDRILHSIAAFKLLDSRRTLGEIASLDAELALEELDRLSRALRALLGCLEALMQRADGVLHLVSHRLKPIVVRVKVILEACADGRKHK